LLLLPLLPLLRRLLLFCSGGAQHQLQQSHNRHPGARH
jgi:hypothetical protein